MTPIYSDAQIRSMTKTYRTEIKFVAADPSLSGETGWPEKGRVSVNHYWNGRKSPDGRSFEFLPVWSASGIFVRFLGRQSEPLVVSREPNLTAKTMNLWDRDVMEIFLAPDKATPLKYFEFEAAPTGEWVDVAIDYSSGKRESNWNYHSGMKAHGISESGSVTVTIYIPWSAFGTTPVDGDVWRGNVFRCVGKDPGRGYLAWSPTNTKSPNFHVPERFGEFVFVK